MEELLPYAKLALGMIKWMQSLQLPVADNIKGLYYNSRLTRAIARCCFRKTNGIKTFYLEVGPMFFQIDEEARRNALVHELIHTFPQCFNHGAEFKYWATYFRQYGYNVMVHMPSEEIPLEAYKYLIQCDNCGKIYKRNRMCDDIKNVQDYRCGRCGGDLKRIK